jgi:hypothetical protein
MGDDLIEHYAGFTIEVILYELEDGGWIGGCVLVQDGADITYGPYEGKTLFATCGDELVLDQRGTDMADGGTGRWRGRSASIVVLLSAGAAGNLRDWKRLDNWC